MALVLGAPEARADCRYRATPDTEPLLVHSELLPAGDLFRPLLADMKEPRFYAGYRVVRFRGGPRLPSEGNDWIQAGLVAMGTTTGLWARRRGCNGVQVSVFGGIFSQFNMGTPSNDLINTDFLGGFPVTMRRGPFSVRARIYHLSSHLGDEFVLKNPDVNRIDHSFEAVDAIASLEGNVWRLYGGVGVLVHSTPHLDPLLLKWGAEVRGPWHWDVRQSHVDLETGIDFEAIQERGWGITGSLKAGVVVSAPDDHRRVRLLLVYLRGFLPFGQFFATEEIENYGLEVQLDL